MNLVIDVGNTRVKLALFKGDSLFYTDSFGLEEILIQLKKIKESYLIDHAIISSVANISNEEHETIKKLFNLFQLTHQTKVPFKNDYLTKNTLGVDRIALAVAAVKKYPNKNVLVIDAGSCITSEFVNNKGAFKGGSISPGIMMRYKALNKFTDKLPLLDKVEDVLLFGNSTDKAMHSGVINGVVAEINGIIEAYKLKYEKLTLVLTGGDTYFLSKRLKNSIFANPNFLLEGLNFILIQNSKND